MQMLSWIEKFEHHFDYLESSPSIENSQREYKWKVVAFKMSRPGSIAQGRNLCLTQAGSEFNSQY